MKLHLEILSPIALLAGMAIAGCSPSHNVTTEPPSVPVTTPPVPSTEETFVSPNVDFAVVGESGTCPETVSLWEFGWALEGGADHTVVVDFRPIALQPVQIVESEERRVVYEAPLNDMFADCVGTARSPHLSMYSLRFGNGTVQFDLDLTEDDGFREIRYADISVDRPYVYWRAAE